MTDDEPPPGITYTLPEASELLPGRMKTEEAAESLEDLIDGLHTAIGEGIRREDPELLDEAQEIIATISAAVVIWREQFRR